MKSMQRLRRAHALKREKKEVWVRGGCLKRWSRERKRAVPCGALPPLNEALGYVAGVGMLATVIATPSFDAVMAEGMREDMRDKGQLWVRVLDGIGATSSAVVTSNSEQEQDQVGDGDEDEDEAMNPLQKRVGVVYRRFRLEDDMGKASTSKSTIATRVQMEDSLKRDIGIAVTSDILGVGALYKRTLRALSSFPLALAELGVLAALSALGTWLEQGLTPDEYAVKLSNSHLLATAVTLLGFDHMFSSPVFLATALLLALSLASCSATRQLPLVKVSKRWKMVSSMKLLARMDVCCILQGRVHEGPTEEEDALLVLASSLASRSYNVFVEEGTLYAFKGLAGRVAPIAVHVSMLAIMAGSTIGALAGASGDALVPVGGVVSTASVLSQKAGPFHDASKDAELPPLLVNDFRIEYNDRGDIDQFYSDLAVIQVDETGENAETISSKTISVNNPLRFNGIAVYQDTWALNTIEVSIDGENVALPMVKLDATTFGVGGDIWGAFLPVDDGSVLAAPGRGAVILARDFQTAFIYNTDGSFVGARRPGSKKELIVPDVTATAQRVTETSSRVGDNDGAEAPDEAQQLQAQAAARDHSVSVIRIGGSTGLRFKQDPGVPLVYAGFAALLVSTLLSYESHSQVWACVARETAGNDGDGNMLISVGGKTNRAKVSFREEVDKIVRDARANFNSFGKLAAQDMPSTTRTR